jgi:hypothetical protein
VAAEVPAVSVATPIGQLPVPVAMTHSPALTSHQTREPKIADAAAARRLERFERSGEPGHVGHGDDSA